MKLATAQPKKPTNCTRLLEVLVRSHGAKINDGILGCESFPSQRCIYLEPVCFLKETNLFGSETGAKRVPVVHLDSKGRLT